MFDKDGFPTNSMRQARRLVISVKDHWGNAAEIPVFGNVWDWKDAIQQQELYLYAETDFFNKTLQIRKALTIDPSQLGSIVALYKGIPERLKSQTVSAAISENLTLLEKAGKLLLQKWRLLLAEFERLTGYPTPHALLLALHAPNSVREGEEALAITRELCVQSIVKAAQANKITRNVPASSIPIQDDVVARLLSALPYTLTKDQQTAIREIVADLPSARPMNRLLAGDVGTGKTLVFLIPLVAAHLAGARVAVMTANQLLVEQALREPVWLSQVHGIRFVDAALAKPGAQADASFTRQRGVVCAILTADCLPVLLCDQRATVVGVAHAGWRGLAAGVVEATVAAMGEPGDRLMAWLGPAIGAQAFEVGGEGCANCSSPAMRQRLMPSSPPPAGNGCATSIVWRACACRRSGFAVSPAPTFARSMMRSGGFPIAATASADAWPAWFGWNSAVGLFVGRRAGQVRCARVPPHGAR